MIPEPQVVTQVPRLFDGRMELQSPYYGIFVYSFDQLRDGGTLCFDANINGTRVNAYYGYPLGEIPSSTDPSHKRWFDRWQRNYDAPAVELPAELAAKLDQAVLEWGSCLFSSMPHLFFVEPS